MVKLTKYQGGDGVVQYFRAGPETAGSQQREPNIPVEELKPLKSGQIGT